MYKLKSVILLVALGCSTSIYACSVYVQRPIMVGSGANRSIAATAQRAGCSNSTRLLLRIRQNRRFYPDRNLTNAYRSGRNFRMGARYRCRGTSHMRVFAEAIDKSNGKKYRSPELAATYCR